MREVLLGRGSTDNIWDPADVPYLVGGVALIAALLGVIAYLLDFSALDVWTAMIVFLVIVGGSVPLFRWVARKDGDPWLFKVLMWALLVHLLFALVRYFFIFVVYGGSADAGVYHEAGATFAHRLRDGQPIHPIPIMNGFPVESQRVGDFTGVLYTVTGPSAYAGFFLFTYICFWGQVLVMRAFRAAVPEGDHRRFALLVLFLPSLLFWPASIGKEALMIGCLGIIVYGGGLLLAPRPKARGALIFVVGSALVLLVRPHVALMSILAFGVAMAVGVIGGFGQARPADGRGDVSGEPSAGTSQATAATQPATRGARRERDAATTRGRLLRLVGLLVLIGLAGIGSTRMSEQFDEYKDEGAGGALTGALEQSSLGGSEFTPASITGPSRLPAGVVSVLFRPFPWEASNLNTLIAAAEGLLLILLIAVGWRRILSFPRLALRRPFLVFCAGYVVLFSIGFSFIGNFGILTRQRVQVLPVLLVFLALPKLPRRTLAPRDRPTRGLTEAVAADAGSL